MKFPQALLRVLLVFAAVQAACAADLFPTPEFSKHPIPQVQTPDSRPAWRAYLDLAFLATATAAASYFAVKSRSRRHLFLLSIVSLAWLGFWRQGCVCPIGAIQNVAQALCDSQYALHWSIVAVFAVPLIFTLFFGRTFCASVCPLGAIQEAVAVRPLQVPLWIDQSLGLLAYVYLGAAVLFAGTGTAWIICRYDPFVGLFRLASGSGMLALSAGFLIVGIFIGRPYCRWLCPYGAILALLSRIARRHLRIFPKECVQCRLCDDACPYGAIRRSTITPAPAQRLAARRRLIVVLGVAPLLIAAGVVLGRQMEGPLAQWHPRVQLAERVQAEQRGTVEGRTDASEAFWSTGEPPKKLYDSADDISRRIGRAGLAFGAWVGLVFAAKLIQLSVRRRRTDYEPDRAACVSCGRCFWYCPEEHTRQELVPLP